MNNVKICVEAIPSRLISHAKSIARQRYVLCHPEEGASSNPDTKHSGLRCVQLQHRVSTNLNTESLPLQQSQYRVFPAITTSNRLRFHNGNTDVSQHRRAQPCPLHSWSTAKGLFDTSRILRQAIAIPIHRRTHPQQR
jgi:hypothetical protein